MEMRSGVGSDERTDVWLKCHWWLECWGIENLERRRLDGRDLRRLGGRDERETVEATEWGGGDFF